MDVLRNLKMKRKLTLLLAIPLLGIIAVAVVGLLTMGALRDHVGHVYVSSAVPLFELSKVSALVPRTRIDVMQAIMDASEGSGYRTPQERADRLQNKIKEMGDAIEKLQSGHVSADLKPQVEEITALYREMTDSSLQPFVAAIRDNKIDDAKAIYPKYIKQYEALRDQVGALMPSQLKIAETAYEAANQTYRSKSYLIYGVLMASFVLCLTIGFVLATFITSDLAALRSTMLNAANRMALGLRAQTGGKDEFGELADAFNRLMSSFESALKRIKSFGDQVSERAGSVAQVARAIAASSEAQSDAAQSTAAAVEQVATSVQHVAKTAKDTAVLSQSVQMLSEQGGRVLSENANNATALSAAMRQTAELTISLSNRSQEINKIVGVIREIADQTNLLALNAAIEAARAGEQGRGFAVVADEVRKLAERTTNATTEVGDMLGGIQSDVGNVVADTERCSQLIEDSMRYSERAIEALQQIRGGAETSARHVSEIASSTIEQGSAAEEIAKQIEQIATMATENSASVQSASSSSDSLARLAQQLEAEIQRFEVT